MAFTAVERFALVDVDGLFLDDPGDELTIPEPIGFSEFRRVIERDDRFFGFTAEYGAASGDLGNDWNKATGQTYSAHQMLDYFITNVGVDSKVLLRYYRTIAGVETLDTEWSVVIDEDTEQIDSTTTLLVQRQDWDNKLRSRMEVDVNLESTTNLDNEANAALSLIEIPLHSKLIDLSVESAQPGVANFDDPFPSKNHVSRMTIAIGTPSIQEIDGYLPPVNFVFGDVDPIDITPLIQNISYDGTLTISFTGDIVWILVIGPLTTYSGDISLKADVYDGVELVGSNTLKTASFSGSSPSVVMAMALDSTNEIEMLNSYSLHVYIEVTVDLSIGSFSGTATVEIPQPTISLTYESKTRPSATTGELIFPILNKAIEKITGQANAVISELISPHLQITFSGSGGTFSAGQLVEGQTSGATGWVVSYNADTDVLVVHSVVGVFEIGETVAGATGSGGVGSFVYLNTGYAAHNFLTSGKKIRGLTTNANLKVQVEKILEFLRCRYAAGFNITEIDGEKYLVIERATNFFRDVEIFEFTSVKSPVKRSIDLDFIFNALEFGYEKYAKENEQGSIKGFNTRRSALSPVQSKKEKMSFIAPVVADDAEIERVRRLDIDQDQSDPSDDEIIVIKCQRFNSANPIYLWKYSAPLAGTHAIVINDASNTITLSGFYLKGQADTASEITIRVISFVTLYTQTITIDSISFDAANNQTIITTTESITAPDGTYTGSAINYFYFDIDILIPERLEGVSNVSGVDDIYSVYNIDHTPSNFLIAWWSLIGGSLSQKEGTEIIKHLSGKNNTSLSKRYISSAANYTTSQITENQDFLLSSLNGYNPPILTPFVWTFEAFMEYDDFEAARAALLGQSDNGDNYGYFTFPDNFGNLVRIYCKPFERDEVTGMVKLVGWQKEVPTPPTTYRRLLETGDIRLLETGDYRLLET